jgi:hypothetical protein
MKYCLVLLLMLFAQQGLSNDAVLPEILALLRQPDAAKFLYRETRQLELIISPSQSQGYMLTAANGTLIKLQLQPSRIIMAIAGERMIYWEPEQNLRHNMPLSDGGEAAQQIELFRAILQGQTDKLQTRFDFTAKKHAGQWLLRLTPKPEQGEQHLPTVEISGSTDDDNLRKIVIRQADSETSEYHISKILDNEAKDYSISGLLQEAAGD